jgi:hypothetical protein
MRAKTMLALAASAMAMTISSTPAFAQDEVVVMRRVVAAPIKRLDNTTPLPTPGATPTPKPTPTPTSPTPTPTPKPTPTPAPGTPAPTPTPGTATPTPTPGPVYGYGWAQIDGQWSSTCSKTATRTNNVFCRRSDATVATDDHCVAADRPQATETREVTSGCTYAPTYGNPTVCTSNTPGSTSGTQTVSVVSCLRSDNTDASVSMCSPATKPQSCRPDNTSDQYARLAAVLGDTSRISTQSVAYRTQSNPITGSTYKFAVQNTLCWDSVNKKTVSDSLCSALAYGANVYDLLSVPAIYVPDLHEIYVAQADLTAANLQGGTYYNASAASTNVSAICSTGGSFSVANASGLEVWTMRCGAADSAAHYQRQAGVLTDPANTFMPVASRGANVSTASRYTLGVRSTVCYDTTAKAVVSSAKCQYIAAGANLYDLVSVPATFVPDLREVYVAQADVQAAMPTGSYLYNYSDNSAALTTVCGPNGMTTFVTVGGVAQQWTLRCGAADNAAHYQRQAGLLTDPANTFMPVSSRGINVATGSTYRFGVRSTTCYDTAAKTIVASAKCQYLSTGANLYDIASVSATYVPDLREVYVAQADVQAAAPTATVLYNYSDNSVALSTACSSGMTTFVTAGGTAQQWTLRCGTPDNAGHYQRQPLVIADPVSVSALPAASRTTNVSTGSTFRFAVTNTMCWDTTSKTQASAAKCQYLSTGANVYDLVSTPATYVADLHEVYVNQADVQATMPNAGTVANYQGTNYTLASVCTNSMTMGVQVAGATQYWSMRCGAADTAGHYQRQIGSLIDPYAVTSLPTASRNVNVPTSSTLTFATRSTNCWDTTAKSQATSSKCLYLPSGSNVNDLVTVPATYMPELGEVYVQQADVQALMPNASIVGDRNGNVYTLATTCTNGIPYNVTVNGGIQSWTMRCGTPDASTYTRFPQRMVDPGVYGGTAAIKATNSTSRATLSVLVDSPVGCWNLTAGAVASTTNKCSYTTRGPAAFTLLTVPATWNVAGATVTIAKSDLLASAPYVPTSSFTASLGVCSGAKWLVGGVNYTVVCQ